MVGAGEIDDVSEPELVKLMVGRDVNQIFPARERKIGERVLEVVGYEQPTEFSEIDFLKYLSILLSLSEEIPTLSGETFLKFESVLDLEIWFVLLEHPNIKIKKKMYNKNLINQI